MNKFFLLATIASCACLSQAVLHPGDHAEIIKQDSQLNADGSYKLEYSTSNGISVQEQGHGGDHATGGYAYYSPEGELIQLSFLADANGFQPQGAHIPTPPPIPPQILKALEYIRTHPYDENAARQKEERQQRYLQQQEQQQQQQGQQQQQQQQQFHHVASASSHRFSSFHHPAQQRRHF